MRDTTKRIANYDYRMNPERIAEKIKQKQTQMRNAYAARVSEMYQIEQLVKEVLATEKGARTIQNPYYHDFARQVYAQRIVTKAGEELNAEVGDFIKKWAARGLNRRILARIRDEVFSIPESELTMRPAKAKKSRKAK